MNFHKCDTLYLVYDFVSSDFHLDFDRYRWGRRRRRRHLSDKQEFRSPYLAGGEGGDIPS